VIVLISKPPSAVVAQRLLNAARSSGKPCVIHFIGYTNARTDPGDLLYASSLGECAELAVMVAQDAEEVAPQDGHIRAGYLRGLFSGGTLAYEAQLLLHDYLADVHSNAPLDKTLQMASALHSEGHVILDLGEDEFTVGRLHPMLDNELRIKRMLQEAADPDCGALLLDVVLGFGAHPDPAAELAPAIRRAKAIAADAGRQLPVVALLVGTDEDPQGWDRQREQLVEAGALVYTRTHQAVLAVAEFVITGASAAEVPLAALHEPLAAVNVGLESFAESLAAQGAAHVHVDWKPPAGGNERLMGILSRMKTKST
jgi:FdrA protein